MKEVDPEYKEGLSDEELIEEFKGGSEESFDILHRRYADSIYRFVYYTMGQRSNSDDLTQEVFLKLYQNAHKYEPTGKFSSWLYRVTRNMVISHIRSTRSERSTLSLEKTFESDDSSTELKQLLGDPNAAADKIALSNESKSILHYGLSKLRPKDREVIVLCDINELPLKEVAQILNCRINDIYLWLSRARKRLMQKVRV